MIRTLAAATMLTMLAAVPVHAADDTLPLASASTSAPFIQTAGPAPSRPSVLPALYVSYAALQVFDVYSTRQALANGAREANPMMQPVVGNQGAFWAMKVSAAAGTIMAAEHLWKKKRNKTAAIAVLAASNAVAAVVAVRNASVLRSQR